MKSSILKALKRKIILFHNFIFLLVRRPQNLGSSYNVTYRVAVTLNCGMPAPGGLLVAYKGEGVV